MGRLYPPGPAAWLQARGAGSPARGRHQPRPLPLAEGGQLIAGKLAQIEAEIAKLQRQHQSLTQCAALLALHPCRYGAPVPHDPESQLHQRDAGQVHKVA